VASHRGGIYAGEGSFFPIHPGSAELSEDIERSCFALSKNVNLGKLGGVKWDFTMAAPSMGREPKD